jgi:hypothetical protein
MDIHVPVKFLILRGRNFKRILALTQKLGMEKDFHAR